MSRTARGAARHLCAMIAAPTRLTLTVALVA
jgi:hypothetical protein